MVRSRKIIPPLPLYLSILLFSLFLLSGCGKPEPPEYCGFQDARLAKDATGQSVLATTLKLYNPNHFSLTLRGGEVDIYVNDRLSGHSILDTSILIPRKDTFYVPVSLQVNMQDILSHVLASFFSKQVKITLNGRVKLRRDGFPFSVPFHYETNQDLSGLIPSGN